MNCLDFRRQLMADPMARDTGLQAHEDDCPGCASFARELRAQEIKLRSLLCEVSPPEGMSERIQLAARFEQRSATQQRWWYGAAAGVLLAIGVSMASLWTTALERGDQALALSVAMALNLPLIGATTQQVSAANLAPLASMILE